MATDSVRGIQTSHSARARLASLGDRVDVWTAVLGLGILAVWTLLTYHGYRDHTVIADSLVATEAGRTIPDGLPGSLWDGRLGRGPEHSQPHARHDA